MNLGEAAYALAASDLATSYLMMAQNDAAAPAEPEAFNGLPFPLLMGIILLMGYFLVFRPQQKKQQETKSQLDGLKEKDRVVTIGGIHGQVTNVARDSDLVTIQVDDATGAKLRINTAAIARVVTNEPSGDSTVKK